MRDIRPLRTESDLDWALEEIETYFDNEPAPATPEADRFDVLAALIVAYEDKHHPIGPSDPIEVLRYAIEEKGRSQAELAAILGSRSRASEILKRQRHLTLEQIRAISAAWNLPIALLAAPYELVRASA